VRSDRGRSGPVGAHPRRGHCSKRWLAQCGVTRPLYTIASTCVFVGEIAWAKRAVYVARLRFHDAGLRYASRAAGQARRARPDFAFKVLNPLQRFRFEGGCGARYRSLPNALNLRHSPVKSRDQFVQLAYDLRPGAARRCGLQRHRLHPCVASVVRRAGFQTSPQREQRQ